MAHARGAGGPAGGCVCGRAEAWVAGMAVGRDARLAAALQSSGIDGVCLVWLILVRCIAVWMSNLSIVYNP